MAYALLIEPSSIAAVVWVLLRAATLLIFDVVVAAVMAKISVYSYNSPGSVSSLSLI